MALEGRLRGAVPEAQRMPGRQRPHRAKNGAPVLERSLGKELGNRLVVQIAGNLGTRHGG